MSPDLQQQNFSMPGPQFNNGQASNSWFSRHSRKIAFAVIIALLLIGANYFYQSYQARTTLLKPTLDQLTTYSPSPAAIATKTTNNSVKSATSIVPVAEKSNDKIIVTAAKSNGQTHLARQALKEYLKDKPDLAQKLGAEQRIYIEDYLRKHLTDQPKSLHPGDQLSFSDNNIQNAIDAALALNDNQIKNLSQYVPLVPSLMTS